MLQCPQNHRRLAIECGEQARRVEAQLTTAAGAELQQLQDEYFRLVEEQRRHEALAAGVRPPARFL